MKEYQIIIPSSVKDSLEQSVIDAVCKDLEDTHYDIVTYSCTYKGLYIFQISWKGKPRYAGIPLYISVDKNLVTEWYRDMDSWNFFYKLHKEQKRTNRNEVV